jgi:uncharacterized Tic20 family protein
VRARPIPIIHWKKIDLKKNAEVILTDGKGLLAFKISCVSALFSLLAVLLYEKPASFYENSGLIVSLSLLVLSVFFSFIALIFAVLSIRTASKEHAVISIVVGVASPILSFLIIIWLAGNLDF